MPQPAARLGPSDLMSTDEVADLIHVKRRTLEDWRSNRTGPRFGRFGKEVRYLRSDVEAYVREVLAAWDEWQAS